MSYGLAAVSALDVAAFLAPAFLAGAVGYVSGFYLRAVEMIHQML